MSIEKDDDEDRRMREISMFSAMASGVNESSLAANQAQISLDLEKSEGHGTSPFLSKVNDAIEDSGTFAILSDHTSTVINNRRSRDFVVSTAESFLPFHNGCKAIRFKQNGRRKGCTDGDN
jgi:hypothetical protein